MLSLLVPVFLAGGGGGFRPSAETWRGVGASMLEALGGRRTEVLRAGGGGGAEIFGTVFSSSGVISRVGVKDSAGKVDVVGDV